MPSLPVRGGLGAPSCESFSDRMVKAERNTTAPPGQRNSGCRLRDRKARLAPPQPPVQVPETRAASALLGHHFDGAAGAFGGANAAALAVIEVDLEPLARTELDHRVVGADAVAIVAFKAIAAAEAAARLEKRGVPRSARPAPRRSWWCVAQCQAAGAGSWARRSNTRCSARSKAGISLGRLGRQHLAAQPGVDVARGLLAVADGDRDIACRPAPCRRRRTGRGGRSSSCRGRPAPRHLRSPAPARPAAATCRHPAPAPAPGCRCRAFQTRRSAAACRRHRAPSSRSSACRPRRR